MSPQEKSVDISRLCNAQSPGSSPWMSVSSARKSRVKVFMGGFVGQHVTLQCTQLLLVRHRLELRPKGKSTVRNVGKCSAAVY